MLELSTRTVQVFGLSRAEALATDPQQRLLLEEAYAALLDGQLATGPLAGTETGVLPPCLLHASIQLASMASTSSPDHP